MSFTCEYCNKDFKHERTLIKHKNNAQYCLKIQSKIGKYICDCGKEYLNKKSFETHKINCVEYQVNEANKKKDSEKELIKLKIENEILNKTKELIPKTQNIETNLDEIFGCELKVNNKVLEIQMRKDGYINATQLCKAGGKELKAWNRNSSTQKFLKELERSVNINTDQLIQIITTGPNSKRGTWVHSHVAINLSQWICPEFAVQVTKWVFDIMTTGKAELKKDDISISEPKKLYDRELSIDYTSYISKDVLYIGTFTPDFEKLETNLNENQKCYKFGVTHNITNRINNHKNNFTNFSLRYLYDCNDGSGRSKCEKYVKDLIKDRGIELKYGDRKELFFATDAQYNEIVERINELQLSCVEYQDSGYDYLSSRRMELEYEDKMHEREEETKRLEIKSRIECKKYDIELMKLRLELAKLGIERNICDIV